eukprot:EG_transcript_14068
MGTPLLPSLALVADGPHPRPAVSRRGAVLAAAVLCVLAVWACIQHSPGGLLSRAFSAPVPRLASPASLALGPLWGPPPPRPPPHATHRPALPPLRSGAADRAEDGRPAMPEIPEDFSLASSEEASEDAAEYSEGPTEDPYEFPTGGMEEAEEDDETAEAAVLNQQGEYDVDEFKIADQLRAIRSILKADDFGVTLVLVGDKESQGINYKFRKVNASTDILSFSNLPPHTPPGVLPKLPPPLRSLGDLIVCVPYVLRQCARDAQAAKEAAASAEAPPEKGVARLMAEGYFTFEERLPLLIIHGMLHLLHYDHETEAEYAEMAQKELQVLAAFEALRK